MISQTLKQGRLTDPQKGKIEIKCNKTSRAREKQLKMILLMGLIKHLNPSDTPSL